MEDLPRSLAILRKLGEQPATSFFEARVAETIEALLDESGIAHRRDAFGNIIARVTRTTPDGQQTPRPLALVAHMDHPGFEITDVAGSRLQARMRGRVSDVVYLQRVDLIVHCSDGAALRARTTGTDSDTEARTLSIEMQEAGDVSLPAYAVFDLPDFLIRDEYVHMRACDDLAGCAATLAAMEILARETAPIDLYGVFTRAEEDGLIGARLLADSGLLPKETVVVSVESSRALPGAEQGNGVVIRVGDAVSTFTQSAEEVLQAARAKLLTDNPPAPIQRQLMSGGVCEASVFLAHGYAATGVAFPLAHYHNGFGEDSVQAESIAVSDFLGGVQLLAEAARVPSVDAEGATGQAAAMYARLRSVPRAEGERLRTTA